MCDDLTEIDALLAYDPDDPDDLGFGLADQLLAELLAATTAEQIDAIAKKHPPPSPAKLIRAARKGKPLRRRRRRNWSVISGPRIR